MARKEKVSGWRVEGEEGVGYEEKGGMQKHILSRMLSAKPAREGSVTLVTPLLCFIVVVIISCRRCIHLPAAAAFTHPYFLLLPSSVLLLAQKAQAPTLSNRTTENKKRLLL